MQVSFGKPNDLRKYSVTAGGDWGGGGFGERGYFLDYSNTTPGGIARKKNRMQKLKSFLLLYGQLLKLL